MSARLPWIFPLLVVFALIASGVLAAPAYSSPPGPIYSSDRPATRSVSQRWIVRLSDAPLAQASDPASDYAIQALRSPTSGKLQIDAPAAQQYIQRLQQQQQALFAALQRTFPAAELHQSYQIVFNGVAVRLPGVDDATAVARLRALPGVVEVYPDQPHALHMYSSLPLIGAEMLWNSPAIGGQASAGEGVKIAIIDAGIKIDNPFFNPEGFSYPEGFPKGNTRFTTPKVIVSRAYFRPDLPPLPGSQTPEPGPEDSSHGTHVAGTAAGVANTTATVAGVTRTISGVAPRAHLMNYKTFYANESVFSGSAFDVELIAALEDAVTDGADVINNSWGGRPGVDPQFDPIVQAAEAAVDAGVTVVFSAGNEGPNLSTAGGPGYSDKLIAVGATTTAQTIAAGFVDVVAPEGVPESLREQPFAGAAFGPAFEGDLFGPAPYVPIAALGLSSLACDPLPEGTLTGQIALIERGVCTFSLKVFHAQQAGAIAAFIYNSEEGGDTLVFMGPGDRADEVTIPSLFVGRSTGVGMIDWYAQHGPAALVQVDLRGRLIDQTPDVIAGFSSRGPSFQGSLKPDIMAPGVNILSAGFAEVEGEPEEGSVEQHLGFGLSSGTSMAAPHAAGSAALLRQIHPDWSPIDIKSALMSTAVTEVWLDEDRTQPAGVLDQGAGRIDVNAAANPGLLFDRPGLSFGVLPTAPGQSVFGELTVTARNVSGAPQTYTLSARNTDGSTLGVGVSPSSIILGAGESASFTVAIELPAGTPAADYNGIVELTGGPQPLHMPVWLRTLPAEAGTKVLLIDNDGSSSLELPDYSGYYGNTLGELGIDFTYLDVDALAGQEQTLPDIGELQKHEIIIWFTGDNFVPSGTFPVPTPLTPVDQDLLIAYLQGGGNLIATGQDLADASDIEQFPPDPTYGRSDLYGYLGPIYIQDNVFTATQTLERQALGTDAQAWLPDIVLDLSVPGPDVGVSDATGAGNQLAIDEIALDDSDPRSPDRYTTPIFRAVSPGSLRDGIIGVNRAAEPTLEEPGVALPYRSTYLAFGLEGVRSDTGATTRKELLQAILYWHVAYPTVEISGPTFLTDTERLVTFTANAASNIPTRFVRYRWDFGDGTPIVESGDRATVVHQYAEPGAYQVRVEVTDNWGHSALGVLEARIESSAASAGELTASGTLGPSAGAQGLSGAPAALAFAETGQMLQGRFLDYWQRHGGLPVFGYPITPQERAAPFGQVFERARFEHHPENAAPYDVLLGRLGVEALAAQGIDWWAFPAVERAPDGCYYFAETRHSLCGAFKAYWERHGLEFDGAPGSSFAESLALFGMPISEPMEELVEGQPRVVQWFERARFEHHPENAAPYDVLLGRLGSEVSGNAGVSPPARGWVTR